MIKRDGTLIGRFDGNSNCCQNSRPGLQACRSTRKLYDNWRCLIEPLRNSGTVYIFGAGHVSQQIAPLSETVGFKTVVLDDRAEYASGKRFPSSSKIILLESFDHLPELAIDEDGYIVIVTRGHLHDKTILAQALKTKAGYIGMIGSRRKRDKIFEVLTGEGFGEQDFERVYSPIGVDIGAETPGGTKAVILSVIDQSKGRKGTMPVGVDLAAIIMAAGYSSRM